MQRALEDIVNIHSLIKVVDPIKSRADAIQIFLAKNGYSRVTVSANLTDFEKDVSKNSVAWLICYLQDENYTALVHTLKRIHHSRVKTRAIVICHTINPQLEKLYKLGILGHILINQNLEEQLSIFLKKVQQYLDTPFKEVGIAAYYKRKIYESSQDWDSLIALEKKLCNRFPRQVGTLVTLVEAYLKAGKTRQAKIVRDQIYQIGAEDYITFVRRLEKEYPELSIPYKDFADTFHIRRSVVIEADDTEYVRIESSLISLTLYNIERFKSFDQAWEYLAKGGEVDLLICEWSKRSKGLTSEQFVQRVRSQVSLSLPIIVLDSNLSENDAQIINDMHINELIRKPIRENDFVMSLSYCIEQIYHPTELKAIERRIEEHLELGDSPYVQFLRQTYVNNPNVDKRRKYYIEGYYCYAIKDYKRSKQLITKGLKEPGKRKNILTQNIDKKFILANCFDHLGDKISAINLILAALKISPRNISFRCYLSALYFEIGDQKNAESALDFAASIDHNHPQVLSLRAKISIIENEQDKLSNLLKHSTSSIRMIEQLNFHANRYQIKGDYLQSLKIYGWIIENIPDNLEDYLGYIYYNQALVFIKDNRFHKAMGALYSAMEYKATDTAGKAKALRQKIEKINAAKGDIRTVFDHFLKPKVNTTLDLENDHEDYGLFAVYAWDFDPIKISVS